MRFKRRATRWYHVTVSTYRRRKVFKIAATARICERVVCEACHDSGWRVDTVIVRADGIQALLEVPSKVRGETVVRLLKAAARGVVRGRPVCDAAHRVFETGHWCAAITDGAKVAALRRHLRKDDGSDLSTPEATAPP